MSKPKKPINVGDRIEWVEGPFIFEPKQVVRVDKNSDTHIIYKTSCGRLVNLRQITKVIRRKKKEKREPRSIWLNENKFNGYDYFSSPFLSRKEADRNSVDQTIRCVEFREVIKGEEK